jgi:hypothetical protein
MVEREDWVKNAESLNGLDLQEGELAFWRVV